MSFFFFQAEDGIRDSSVTGVQTCALPILEIFHPSADYRERSDKIATMSVNPKSTQLPVTNMVPSMRAVGFARNVLSLSIDKRTKCTRSRASQKAHCSNSNPLEMLRFCCHKTRPAHDQNRTSNRAGRSDPNEQKNGRAFSGYALEPCL